MSATTVGRHHMVPDQHQRFSGRAVLAAAAVVTVLVLSVIVALTLRPGPSSAQVRNISAAPASARPLINKIARRNKSQCGKGENYVAVSAVSSDAKTVLLTVVCVFGSADPITLTHSGWSEGGVRQLSFGERVNPARVL